MRLAPAFSPAAVAVVLVVVVTALLLGFCWSRSFLTLERLFPYSLSCLPSRTSVSLPHLPLSHTSLAPPFPSL